MLFQKVCPRCGRKYPRSFTGCLECGGPLIEIGKLPPGVQLKRYIPALGLVFFCIVLFVTVLVCVLPLIQYSLVSGEEFGIISKASRSPAMTITPMNQPAGNDKLQVSVSGVRDGTPSANSKKFLLVTVTLHNLQEKSSSRVACMDFTLHDGSGHSYAAYSLDGKIAVEVPPLSTRSYDLTFEIPRDATDLDLQYTIPGTIDRNAQEILYQLK